MLSDKPPIISIPVIVALKAPICTIGGIPDASHITVGSSTTKSTAPSRYPNISFNSFILLYFCHYLLQAPITSPIYTVWMPASKPSYHSLGVALRKSCSVWCQAVIVSHSMTVLASL